MVLMVYVSIVYVPSLPFSCLLSPPPLAPSVPATLSLNVAVSETIVENELRIIYCID